MAEGVESLIYMRMFLAPRFESGLRKINKMVVKYSVVSHVLAFPNLRPGRVGSRSNGILNERAANR